MQHKLAALRFWFIEIRIALRARSEPLTPGAFEGQTKRSIESMARFVAENAQTLGIGSPFHLQHLLALELHQAGMSEIKRDGNAGNAVRRKPFFGEPNVRFKANAAIV